MDITHVPPAGPEAWSINDLDDVAISSAVQYQHLEFDGSNWVNVSNMTLPANGTITLSGTGKFTAGTQGFVVGSTSLTAALLTMAAGGNITVAGGEVTITEDTAGNTPFTINMAANQSASAVLIKSSTGALRAEIKQNGSFAAYGDGEAVGLNCYTYFTDAAGGVLNLGKSRGNAGTKAIVNDNDSIGIVRFLGYDGSSFLTVGSVELLVDGSPSGGVVPTEMVLSTCLTNTAVPHVRITPAGVTKIGDAGTTHYAQFAADGELNLFGTARVTRCKDLEAPFLGQGATAPSVNLTGNYVGYEYDINDDSVVTFKLPNDWAVGTDLTIGLRYHINEAYGAASGEIRFQAAWSAVPANATEAVDAPTHTGTATGADQNIPATAKFLQSYSVGTIAAANLSAGDEIGITVKRIALDGGTDPTADPVVTCVGVTYIADKLGAAT